MTICCAWCQKFLREVCPSCGHDALPFFFSWRLFLHGFRGGLRHLALRIAYSRLTDQLYMCNMICKQVLFLRGLGGIGEGLCDDCKTKTRFAQVARGGIV
jgi:hypothetical protein